MSGEKTLLYDADGSNLIWTYELEPYKRTTMGFRPPGVEPVAREQSNGPLDRGGDDGPPDEHECTCGYAEEVESLILEIQETEGEED